MCSGNHAMKTTSRLSPWLLLLALPGATACRSSEAETCPLFYASWTQPCWKERSRPSPEPTPTQAARFGHVEPREANWGTSLSLQNAYERARELNLVNEGPVSEQRLVSFSISGVQGDQIDVSPGGHGEIRATYLVTSTGYHNSPRPLKDVPQAWDGEILVDSELVTEVGVVIQHGQLDWRATRAVFVRPALPATLPAPPSCSRADKIDLHVEKNGAAMWLTTVPAQTAPCGPTASPSVPNPVDPAAKLRPGGMGSLASCCASAPPGKRVICNAISSMVSSGKTGSPSGLVEARRGAEG